MFPDADRPVAIEWAAMGHSLAGYPITLRQITTRYRCLPTGVTGSRSRPTPPGFSSNSESHRHLGVSRWPTSARRVSFAHAPVSILGWIYDPDHSLAAGMYVDVPDFDRLLVAPPITVEGLDHVILKPKKFDRVVAVNVDEFLGHLSLALSAELL